MSVTIDSNGVQLVGDGFGVNWARKQLAAAPATAKKMQFVYRAWFDTVTSQSGADSTLWDSCSFFGLGFDNTMFEFDNPFTSFAADDFFGWTVERPPNSLANGTGTSYPNRKILDYHNATRGALAINGGDTASPFTAFQPTLFWDGIGGNPAGFSASGYTGNYLSEELISFAANPTAGAAATWMWEVWSGLNDNTVMARCFKDVTSVAEGDAMFDVMDGQTIYTGASSSQPAGSVREFAIHGDTTSTWIDANGVMTFPRWLKFKYTFPTQTLVLKYFKIRYLDINDNVIG